MKNQNHGASEHDSDYQTSGASDGGFVVPEPDGVTSGHPFGDENTTITEDSGTARAGGARATSRSHVRATGGSKRSRANSAA